MLSMNVYWLGKMFIINISEKADSWRVYRAFQFCKMFKHRSKLHRKKFGRSYTKRLSLGSRVTGDFFLFFLVYILIFFKTSKRALLVWFFFFLSKIKNKQTNKNKEHSGRNVKKLIGESKTGRRLIAVVRTRDLKEWSQSRQNRAGKMGIKVRCIWRGRIFRTVD